MTNRRNILAVAAFAGTAAAMTLPAVAQEMMTVGTGQFEGRSNHETSGSVKVIEEDGRSFVVLGEDFSLDGGPDPRVSFGNDGEHDGDTILGALVSFEGKQRYAVPSTWDASAYNEVYIWCEVAGVPLGVASIK